MKLRNLHDLQPTAIHGGAVRAWTLFWQDDLLSSIRFINDDLMEPGAAVELHQHADMEEICYILSGVGEVRVGGEVRPIGEGDAVYLPPQIDHNIKNTGSSPLRFLTVAAMVMQPQKP